MTSLIFCAFTNLHCVCAGAQAALSALYQSVQARRATHEPLLALSGRLELVRAQLDKATNDVHMHIKPQVLYLNYLCHFVVHSFSVMLLMSLSYSNAGQFDAVLIVNYICHFRLCSMTTMEMMKSPQFLSVESLNRLMESPISHSVQLVMYTCSLRCRVIGNSI